MENMKAVRIHNYGGPEVLRFEDAPRPAPGSGELLIRVHAAAVNLVDEKIRAGYLKEIFPFALPFIPGWTFPASSKPRVEASPSSRRATKSTPVLPSPAMALTRNTL